MKAVWKPNMAPFLGARVKVVDTECHEINEGYIQNMLESIQLYLVNLDNGISVEVGREDIEVISDAEQLCPKCQNFVPVVFDMTDENEGPLHLHDSDIVCPKCGNII